MAHSTKRSGDEKMALKLPRPDFPLRVHKGTGYWCKKVRGRVHYFGRVADDPDGAAAEEEWNRVKDDLYHDREPGMKPDALTVVDLVNAFLEHKESLRDHGELSPRTYRDYYDTCANMVKALGRNRAVAKLRPADFAELRNRLAKTMGAVTLRNEMGRVRSVFKFGFDQGYMTTPMRFGQSFVRPKIHIVRKEREAHRAKYGDRMFEAAEVRQILAYLDGQEVSLKQVDEKTGEPVKVKGQRNPSLKTMILLAANCAFGQADLSRLPVRAMDLESGWLDFARVKTGIPRRIPLWPETIQAVQDWMPCRPQAKSKSHEGLLFLTPRGGPCITLSDNGGPRDNIGQAFGKLIARLRLKRPRLSFYGFRRGFETVGGELADQVAVDAIMGHGDPSMAAHYRERIGDDRLRRVVDHVRAWVFTDSPTAPETGKPAADTPAKAKRTPKRTPKAKPAKAEGAGPTLRLFVG